MTYKLDKPVEFCGEWYVAVNEEYDTDLYLRRDLTVQDGTWTNYRDDDNNGLWETEKEATKAIRDYYSKNKGN